MFKVIKVPGQPLEIAGEFIYIELIYLGAYPPATFLHDSILSEINRIRLGNRLSEIPSCLNSPDYWRIPPMDHCNIHEFRRHILTGAGEGCSCPSAIRNLRLSMCSRRSFL